MDEKIRRSRGQEAAIAKRLGGTRNAGSGNGWQRKHDVRTPGKPGEPGILWEMKRTDNAKSLTIKVAELDSTHKEAWKEDRIPAFHFEIGTKRYIMMEESDAMERLGLDDDAFS